MMFLRSFLRRGGRRAAFLTAVVAALWAASPASAQRETNILKFSGFEWEVRGAGKGGPGPNQWDAAAVSLDAQGFLHLKIRKVGTEWRCAELFTTTRQGFGTYSFALIGRPDKFDQNIVLGLFTYPTPDVGTDGTNEIDIEFAHWGDPRWNIGNYTVYPASGPAPENKSFTFPLTLNGDYSLHRFRWESKKIVYDAYHGHAVKPEQRIASWTYAPPDSRLIPQKPVPLHINLWLFNGKPPTDGKEVEVILKSVTYTP